MKIRNIFALTMAATLFFGSCSDEGDMTKVDEWLGEKFNQEIRWDVDSLAFRRTTWEMQDIAGGLQLRKSTIKMWDSMQSVSYMTYSPVLFNTYLGYTGSEATVGDIAGGYENALFAINAGSLSNGKPEDFFKLDGELKNGTPSDFADAMFGLSLNEIDENTTIINAKLTQDVMSHDSYTSAMVTRDLIVRDGVAVESFPKGEFYDTRMARTFIGLNNAGNCILGIIDGGVTGKADGATAREAAFIAQLMGLKMAALLGCGDETTAWSAKDGVINAPSAGSAQKVGSVIYVGPGSVKVEGDGSQTNPYLIDSYIHMMLMRNLTAPETINYFRLEKDIDMTEVKLWTPVNYDDPYSRQIHFDGNGKTISNFAPDSFVQDDQTTAASYPSLFGMLWGSCKNLTIKDAKVLLDADYATACGILGGFVGTGDKPATVENVNIVNAELTGKTDLGLFGGQSRDATYKNCSATGKIVIGNMANTGGNGGFIGRAAGKVSLEDCTSNVHYSASVDPGKSFRLGGLIGYAATIGGQDLERDKLTIKRCSTTGTVFNDKYGPQAVAGMVGYMGMPVAEITESFTTISIEGGRTISGGAGGNTQCCGGMIGICSTANKCTIKDCYSSTGQFVVGQKSGGIVGCLEKGELVVENCYSTYAIHAYSGAGGILGIALAAGPTVMKNSFAWNSSVTAFRTSAANYSSGAFAGSAEGKNTISGCFRHPQLQFTDPFRTMKTHGDLANGTPENDNETNAEDGNTHQNAYDAQPSAEETLTAAAKKAGWSEDIWDFSGDIPVLKWTLASDDPQGPEDPKDDCDGVCTECGCECTCDEHHSNK